MVSHPGGSAGGDPGTHTALWVLFPGNTVRNPNWVQSVQGLQWPSWPLEKVPKAQSTHLKPKLNFPGAGSGDWGGKEGGKLLELLGWMRMESGQCRGPSGVWLLSRMPPHIIHSTESLMAQDWGPGCQCPRLPIPDGASGVGPGEGTWGRSAECTGPAHWGLRVGRGQAGLSRTEGPRKSEAGSQLTPDPALSNLTQPPQFYLLTAPMCPAWPLPSGKEAAKRT